MSTKQSVPAHQPRDLALDLAADLAFELAPEHEPDQVGDVGALDDRTTVEQLALFHAEIPERFRIDEVTRRRGLLHIARIKAQLARRYPPDPPPVPRPRTPLGARARNRAA